MGRLRLLLADEDQAYIESLTGYIMDKFPYKFQVNFFTDIDKLHNFLLNDGSAIDVILASESFINEIKKIEYIKESQVLIKIIDRRVEKKDNTNEKIHIKMGSIYKYCHGDKLVENIINIYEKALNVTAFNKTKLNTIKIIAVYSPAGGAGKTTIAMHLLNCFTKLGLKAFYLNLESMNSLSCFRDENQLVERVELNKNVNEIMNSNINGKIGLSKVLFALKENDDKLNEKIKEIVQYDQEHKIAYFLPPDCSLELDEISPQDIKRLLNEIESMGLYDIILLDLSSSLDHRNILLMKESHEIMVIATPDIIAINKLNNFLKDIQLHERKENMSIISKMTVILNKWDENASDIYYLNTLNDILTLRQKIIQVKLPKEENKSWQNFMVDENSRLHVKLQRFISKHYKSTDYDFGW